VEKTVEASRSKVLPKSLRLSLSQLQTIEEDTTLNAWNSQHGTFECEDEGLLYNLLEKKADTAVGNEGQAWPDKDLHEGICVRYINGQEVPVTQYSNGYEALKKFFAKHSTIQASKYSVLDVPNKQNYRQVFPGIENRDAGALTCGAVPEEARFKSLQGVDY
jgi:hypothetical protein